MILRAFDDGLKSSDKNPPSLAEMWSGCWPQTLDEFEDLVETFQHRLIRYAFRRLGSIQDAEDVIQNVFIRAYAMRKKYRKVVLVGPYLYRMAANTCTDLLRKRSRRSEISLDEIETNIEPIDRTDAAQVAAAAEELKRIETMLHRLPHRQAEVIRYRIFDDLSFSEVAAVLGRSQATVKSRFRYGLHKLKTVLLKNREVV